MKRSTKKGFTIVELVIVIAIIAILAAVLIPTFASLIQKANESKDTQLVKNLNTALAADNKEHKTMTDALDAAVEFGYDVGKINASATNKEILWDSKNDVFCYYDTNTKTPEYIPETSLKNGTVAENETYKLWKIYTEAPTEQTFSIYWNSTENFGKDLTVGFDAGECTAITTLNYVRTGDKQDVVIRTKGATTLTVDAEKDTIYHYGEAGSVKVIKCDTASYHEFGKVVGNLEIAKGRLELAASANVNTVLVSSAAEGDVKIDVASGATVGTIAPVTDKALADVNASTTIPADAKLTEVITVNTDFAGGLGTERSPYLIANAEQFAKIAGFSVKMLNKSYSFALINDIDLSEVKFNREYVSFTFNGTLNGNNHKIYTGNELSVLFNGTLGNTVYKDFAVSLSNKLTRVTNHQYATNETEKTTLIYDNVDLTGVKGVKYNLGSDNSAYYVDGTFCGATILAEENEQIVIKKNNFWTQNQYVTVANCDVDVDFSMTGTRAAVFCGGQVYTMHITIKDSTYSGAFYGANPGLVFANYNCCDGDSLLGSIELNNIKLIGKLICLNANSQHGLTFANNNKELANVEGVNNIVECAVDDAMNITLKDNSEYTITAAQDTQINNYVVQLSLGKLYWYDNAGNVTNIEASNYTFSIRVSATNVTNTGIYKVASLSIKQAANKGIDTSKLDWKESENNVKYAFATMGEDKFLVLDISGDFADESRLNVANIIGYIGDMPKYYKVAK